MKKSVCAEQTEESLHMKKHNVAAAILFCGFLAAMALGYLLPQSSFSDMEKRYLAEMPAFQWKAVSTGKWGREIETYLTDHVPGRNLLVGINAYMELLAGRQHLKDIWVEDKKLLEAPVSPEEAAVARNMKAINGFAENIGQTVDLMVVPSAGWAAGVEGYEDGKALEMISQKAEENVRMIPVQQIFAGNPALYYNTDHHWTSGGACKAYEAYMAALGRDCRTSYRVTTVEGFHGSTYARSALWLTPAESIELWHGNENLTVTNGETEGEHSGIFYEERLQSSDMYTVFLDGNHSLVQVKNPDKQGKLLVIRDSYGNCLGGFLAESYGEVVLVDLRYYHRPVSELVQQEKFDNILVCYNCLNFLTDTNLATLR